MWGVWQAAFLGEGPEDVWPKAKGPYYTLRIMIMICYYQPGLENTNPPKIMEILMGTWSAFDTRTHT